MVAWKISHKGHSLAGEILWGFFYAQTGGGMCGLQEGWLYGATLVCPSLQTPPPLEEGGERCQGNLNAPVPTPAVPSLLMGGSVRNTPRQKPSGTRPTTEIRKHAAAMDGLGNASVTAMYNSTRCVSCASVTESLYQPRRSTTRCP